MTIRGGGNPHSAMAAMPLREWTRRLGALPAEAYDCFMVGTPYGFNRIQAWFARLIAANGRLPSDHRAANHPIAGSLPPCLRPSRTSLPRRGSSAVLDRRCARRRWKYAVGTEECSRRGSNKRMECKGRPKWRDAPLTKKTPYKPDALIGHVRFDERGWETQRCRMAQATAPILDSTKASVCAVQGHVRSWG